MKQLKNILKFSAVVMLIAVMALTIVSCSKDNEESTAAGEITITVEVINKAGESTEHEIKTTKTTLADALLEAGIVEGTTDEYGLYITTVDGELADYSADQSYWAISKDGEYLMTGASSTNIADGEHYELTYTVYAG
jgi:metal-dependent hydrolase (beta-lactamase superfamily II)